MEPLPYPLSRHDDLTVPDEYLDLQRQGPIRVQLPYGEPAWLLTRYEDVKTAYGDKRFNKAYGLGRDTPRSWPMRIAEDPSVIANMDGAQHTRVRRLTLVAFSPAQVKTLRPWIEELADGFLDHMLATGRGADFETEFAWALPLRVITGILGVPVEEAPTFKGWADAMLGIDSTTEERNAAHEQLNEYVRMLIAERRERDTGDLLCLLVQARDDDDHLTEDELVRLAETFFMAGFETTAAQLGSTLFTLLSQRRYWDELLADRTLLPAALEELWRWIPSFRFGMPMVRWALDEVELSGGVVVRKGDVVVPEHELANRDESVFPKAAEIDFHRVEPQPHLALAWGAHRCLGAHLAHLEVEVMLEKLLDRLPTLDLAVAPDDVTWSTRTFLRTPAELPVTW
jgi:cytochrome P450